MAFAIPKKSVNIEMESLGDRVPMAMEFAVFLVKNSKYIWKSQLLL